MKGLTASKLGLARECPAAFALPHTDDPNEFVGPGVERHADQDAAITRGDVPEAYRERWPAIANWRSEVKFAVDVVTGKGRELGIGSDRAYDVTDTEIAGTADVVGFDDEILVVIDKKSFDPNVPRAHVNAQVHIAALALCSAHRKTLANVAIDHELRALDVAVIDTFDMENFREEIRQVVANVQISIETGAKQVNEGTWCRWCPAFKACPAKQALAIEVGRQADILAVELRSPIGSLESDDDAARVYEFAERARMLIKRLDASLYARAKERPIPLGNGKVFGAHMKKGRESLDGDVAYTVVRELHGQEVADAAVTRDTSKAAIKRALEIVVGKGGVASAERKLIGVLRERGGVVQGAEREVVEEFDVQQQIKGVG